MKDDFFVAQEQKGEMLRREIRNKKTERDREEGGVLVRWKENSISSPSSEMGDTVRTGLLHPKYNRTRFECLYDAGSIHHNAPLQPRCFLLYWDQLEV